jgi:hypothetical protein
MPLLILAGIGGLALWVVIYRSLLPFAVWFAGTLLGLAEGTHLREAVTFFVYDTPKVLMLLVLVVFGVGIVRTFFTPERTRALLAGKRESVGNVLAALLGIVTPFCTCSAVPLFIGFVSAGIPLGVTFSFLVSSPMVNEVGLALLLALFGWKIAGLYLATGLTIAIVSGWVIGRLKMERHVEPWVFSTDGGGLSVPPEGMAWEDRLRYAGDAVREIVGRTWPWIVGGLAVGAAIHGYVPEGVMASIMGKKAWWSVPLAVAIGIPIYSSVAGIVPVIQALLAKGAALGTALAFMMAVTALSLPEMVILRRVLKPKLIGAFIGVVGAGILLVGYLFNAIL